MRPIWNGMISFGLVNIPVGVFSATRSERLEFHLLHEKDLGRINNVRVCQVDGEEVAYEDLVKGYEYEKGEYLVLTDEDFEKAAPETSKTISITDFVDVEEIDPMFFETPYYLAPGKNADHAYVILRETLKQTQKAGIAKVAFREREHLAAVKPHGRALMLDIMHFPEEISPAGELDLPAEKATIKDKELKLAAQLVESMTAKFDPKKYKDTYRERLEELIEKKLKGKTIHVKASKRKATTNVVDIMALLQKSLKASGKQKTKVVASHKKKAARAKAA
jgi:DNA end-binding protein Ku